jgi:hypothetical protein
VYTTDRHDGEYREDRRHGYGVYTWQTGDRYEGYWQEGRMCGAGVKYMANGGESHLHTNIFLHHCVLLHLSFCTSAATIAALVYSVDFLQQRTVPSSTRCM